MSGGGLVQGPVEANVGKPRGIGMLGRLPGNIFVGCLALVLMIGETQARPIFTSSHGSGADHRSNFLHIKADTPFLNKAMHLHDAGQFAEAVASYSQAIDQGGLAGEDLALAYFNRGIARYELARQNNNDNLPIEQLDLAITDIEAAFEIVPDAEFDDTAHTNASYLYAARGIERFQKLGVLIFDLALTAKDHAIVGVALTDLDRAIELNPAYGFAYYWRSLAISTSGEYLNSIVDLSQAIQLEPDSAFLFVERAKNLVAMGQYEFAIHDLTVAYEMGDSSAREHRGDVYELLGEFEKARQDLWAYGGPFGVIGLKERRAHYRSLNKPQKEAWLRHAACWKTIAFNAIEKCSLALQDPDLSPEDRISALFRRGQAYAANTAWAEAINDFSEVVSMDDNHATAHLILANIFAVHPDSAMRAGDRALIHAEKARVLAEREEMSAYSIWPVLDSVAAAYAADGRFEEAVKAQQLAVDKLKTAFGNVLAEQIAKALSPDKDKHDEENKEVQNDLLAGPTSRLRLYQSGKAYVESAEILANFAEKQDPDIYLLDSLNFRKIQKHPY